jgi:hypothetical protein
MAGERLSVPYDVEIYTPERIAEFLLTGAVDEEDYGDACETVRKMGLDPAKIEHLRAFEL